MATFDFQKLGLDRAAQNIARAVNSPNGRLVTGDITKGEVVEVSITSNSGTSVVKARRVGAMPISNPSGNDLQWSISGTTLSVSQSGGGDQTVAFWVF